jgi:uncharacterized membrane protein YgcG
MGSATFLRHGRALGLVLGLAAFGACNNVGDAICPYGTNPDDHADGCPYGPPGGPRVHEEGCPDISQMTGAMCSLSWRNDIWPLLNNPAAPPGQACGKAGVCHGTGANAGGLALPADDPVKSFNVLKAYTPQQGYPYINDSAPGHTWILCNLQGTKGGRSPMPQAPNFPLGQPILDKVKVWAQCGERLDAPSGASSSSSGGGGGGGMGGAGGAGGTGGGGGAGGM